MKYWKNGFYDEPQESSVEITEEYYQELLAGQSAGLLIVESKKGYPILVEPQYSLDDVRKNKVSEIQMFDIFRLVKHLYFRYFIFPYIIK